jgi:hypothetical protein
MFATLQAWNGRHGVHTAAENLHVIDVPADVILRRPRSEAPAKAKRRTSRRPLGKVYCTSIHALSATVLVVDQNPPTLLPFVET